jgi:hypothetical protein
MSVTKRWRSIYFMLRSVLQSFPIDRLVNPA